MPANAAPATVPERRGFCTPPALAEIIRDLYLDECTGVLGLSRSGVAKRLILDRGMIVAATSSLEDERLPVFLAQRGLIPKDEAEALRNLDDRRAAEALLSRGRLTREALAASVHTLAQQILTAVFRWEELEFRYVEGESAAWPVATNVVISFELIIRALRSMAGFAPIVEALRRQDRAVRLADELYVPFEQLSLTAIEGFLVSRIDGRTRPRDILAQVPPSEEEEASRFLFGLLILGLAQFAPPIGSGMLSCALLLKGDEEKRRREENEMEEVRAFYTLVCSGNPAAALGIAEGSTPDDIRAAYDQRKERHDPGRYLRRVQVEMKEELQIIEARLLEAFLAMRSRTLASRRAAPDADKDSSVDLEVMSKRKELSKSEKQSSEAQRHLMAEQYFAKAREYWKLGDMFGCIRYCEFAFTHNDSEASILSLLGQALSRNPDHRWQRRAEAALLRAAELDAFNPAHWVLLGEFYRQNNLFGKARKHFEKALEIVPSHEAAQEALKSLPPLKS